MNIQAMMAQARKMKKNIEKTTMEIENSTYFFENENIYVEATGNNKIKQIKIKNEDILEDKEILEDIVVVAVNDVLNQILKTKESKLGKYTAGLGGLF